MKQLIVTGIGTGVGKTVVSAILCKALEADYWKPVQTGTAAEPSDSETLKSLVDDPDFQIFPSTYSLKEPLSPHAAAAAENVEIDIGKLLVPRSKRGLIIEGAGGLMVPLNSRETFKDWISSADIPVIVVSRHYLGSINHTLLTIETLKNYRIKVAGLVFVGQELPGTSSIISKLGATKVLASIPEVGEINSKIITTLAAEIKMEWE